MECFGNFLLHFLDFAFFTSFFSIFSLSYENFCFLNPIKIDSELFVENKFIGSDIQSYCKTTPLTDPMARELKFDNI